MKKTNEKGYESILGRLQNQESYRNAQVDIGLTEDLCKHSDALAEVDSVPDVHRAFAYQSFDDHSELFFHVFFLRLLFRDEMRDINDGGYPVGNNTTTSHIETLDTLYPLPQQKTVMRETKENFLRPR